MRTNLPHLLVTDFERNDFTKNNTPIPAPPRPARSRSEHSALLKRQLEQAWADAGNDEVVYQTRRNGVYLEFKGEQGHKLITRSLENLRGNDSSNLDTGVSNGHPLIEPVLNTEDCQSVNPEWGSHDHDKHGTLMAGLSAYGSLLPFNWGLRFPWKLMFRRLK